MSGTQVVRVSQGVFRVVIDGRVEVVYVGGSGPSRWAFCNGEVFREAAAAVPASRPSRSDIVEALTAPMPARVLKVLVAPGAAVSKGDTLVILEAMKMELPLRATAAATVTSVHCREGELVQPGTVLVELS